MNKILSLSLTLALITFVVLLGVETFAYTINAEPSGNSFVAGSLDLKTNDADGISQTLYAISMSPGATVGSTITLKNNGTTEGTTLDIVVSYAESDSSPNTVDKTVDETASLLEVITINYAGPSLLGSISDSNSNGYKDVYDLMNSNLTGLIGIGASATRNFDISVRLRDETANDFQSDGIIVTMTFTLKQ